MRLHRDVTVDIPVTVLGEGGVEVDVEALEAQAASASEQPEAAAPEASEGERDFVCPGEANKATRSLPRLATL